MSNQAMSQGGATGHQLSALKEQLKLDIRALLLSSKDGLTEQELNREYYELNNRRLPFSKLGHKSLYDFLKTQDWVQIRQHRTGVFVYHAVHDNLTQNLGRLIQGQLDPKKAVRERKRVGESCRSRSLAPTLNRPNYHNVPYDYKNTNTNRNFFQKVNNGALTPFVPHKLQQNIENILKQAVNYRMHIVEFMQAYKQIHLATLNPDEYNFQTLLGLFESMPHLINVEKLSHNNNSFYITLKISDVKTAPNVPLNASDNQPKVEKPQMVRAPVETAVNGLGETVKTDVNNNTPTPAEEKKTSVSQAKQTFKGVTIENLKALIKSFDTTGVKLSCLCDVYEERYGRKLDFDRLGYPSLFKFLLETVHKYVRFVRLDDGEEDDDCILRYREPRLDDRDENDDDDDDDDDEQHDGVDKKADESNESEESEDDHVSSEMRKKMKAKFDELVTKIRFAFRNYQNVKMKMDDFERIFAEQNGAALNVADYGFGSFDQLACRLHENQIMKMELDHQMQFLIYFPNCEHKKSSMQHAAPFLTESLTSIGRSKRIPPNDNLASYSSLSNRTICDLIDLKEKTEKIRKYQAEFVQEYVTYDDLISQDEVLATLAKKPTHKIIVSNVKDPSNIQFQLADNVPALNKLMDDLEKVYYGIGTTSYNMPLDYVKLGRVCVALFSGDENWHRCRIVEVNSDRKLARVMFIDYGGDEWVQASKLKFLAKEFKYLPVQAVDGHFAGITKPASGHWNKETVNYLLNRVMGKTLEATIVGSLDNSFALEINDRTTISLNGCPPGTLINLNKRILQDAFGTWFDEQKQDKFADFENWRKIYILDEHDQDEDSEDENNEGNNLPNKPKDPERNKSATSTHSQNSFHRKEMGSTTSLLSNKFNTLSIRSYPTLPNKQSHHHHHHHVKKQPVVAKIAHQISSASGDSAASSSSSYDSPSVAAGATHNNTTSTNNKSIASNKPIDNQLAERYLIVQMPARTVELHLIRKGTCIYLHPSELAALCGVNTNVVDLMIKTGAFPEDENDNNDQALLKKFSNTRQNREIFGWLETKLNISDSASLTHVHFFHVTKLEQTLGLLVGAQEKSIILDCLIKAHKRSLINC